MVVDKFNLMFDKFVFIDKSIFYLPKVNIMASGTTNVGIIN